MLAGVERGSRLGKDEFKEIVPGLRVDLLNAQFDLQDADFTVMVFIAGDDVSFTPAWVEGAVQTSLNAVWGIVKHLGGRTHAANPGPGDVFAELGPMALPD